ncbi:helix-turn-helix transcriptional regulator [Alicyclobacillus acidoterrestris]|uniref:helix-turn-helix transcriptional regulator n=1 Tax=Alicyclobacillus acidoterrestris TaxID=1450 RepID=UPI003F53667F
MKRREALVYARKAKNMTQYDLASKVQISRAFLANVERGEHTPSLPVAIKIAEVLEEPVEKLFCEIDVRKTNTA